MTAHEQALSAAEQALEQNRNWYGWDESELGYTQYCRGYADKAAKHAAAAVSGVWQPIVQAFIDAKAGVNQFGVVWNTARLRAAYRLAEEALGLPVTQPESTRLDGDDGE